MPTYISQTLISPTTLAKLQQCRPDVMNAVCSPGYHNPSWTVEQMYYDWWYNIKPPEYYTWGGDIDAYAAACSGEGGIAGISWPILLVGAGMTMGAIWFMTRRR